MMKHPLNILFSAAVAMAVLSLSGCGNKPAEENSAEKQKPNQDYDLPTIEIEKDDDQPKDEGNTRFKAGVWEEGVPSKNVEPRKAQQEKGSGIENLSKDPEKAKELLLSQRIQNKNSKWQYQRETPANSMAERLQKNSDKKFVWLPKYTGNIITPIMVPDVQISLDCSTLVFVEWYQTKKQQFGSRLIFMDTSTWSFIDYIEVPQRKIGKVAWLPAKNAIAGVCLHQPNMAQPNGIVKIDLETKSETGFIRMAEGCGLQTFLPLENGGKLIVSHAVKPELLLIDCEKFEKDAVQHIAVPYQNCICALSQDGKKLAIAAPKAKSIVVYATEDMKQISDRKLPNGYPLEQIVYLANGKDFFITGKSAVPVSGALLRNTLINKIPGRADGMAFVAKNGQQVYHLLAGREISIIDAVTGQEKRHLKLDAAPPTMKNPAPGRIVNIFELSEINGLAVFDANGNFYLISLKDLDKRGKHAAERIILFSRKK